MTASAGAGSTGVATTGGATSAQHFFHLRPEPHGQRSLRPVFMVCTTLRDRTQLPTTPPALRQTPSVSATPLLLIRPAALTPFTNAALCTVNWRPISAGLLGIGIV